MDAKDKLDRSHLPGFAIDDRKRVIVYANHKIEDYFPFSSQQIVGKTFKVEPTQTSLTFKSKRGALTHAKILQENSTFQDTPVRVVYFSISEKENVGQDLASRNSFEREAPPSQEPPSPEKESMQTPAPTQAQTPSGPVTPSAFHPSPPQKKQEAQEPPAFQEADPRQTGVKTLEPLDSKASLAEKLAYEDKLTGLANFNIIEQFLEVCCKDATSRRPLALLALSIDEHEQLQSLAGKKDLDQVTLAISSILKSLIHKPEALGRTAPNEFMVVIPTPSDHIESETQAYIHKRSYELVRQISQHLKNPIEAEKGSYKVHLSFGQASFPDISTTSNQLIDNAREALREAKQTPIKDQLILYNKELDLKLTEHKRILIELQQGIQDQHFELHYQPIIRLKDGAFVGAEALLRWRHPEKGLISPGEFLPQAIQSNLIIPLGEWVLEQACLAISKLEGRFVSINLSGVQLLQSRFVEHCLHSISISKIQPQLLVVELAENIDFQHHKQALEALLQLGEYGVGIGIDDFGTGASSLKQLRETPLRFIKIDHSFVCDIKTDPQTLSLIKMMVQLANSLSVPPLAEGVESEDQHQALLELECEFAQGHLFAKPMPFRELLQFMASHP